MDVVQEKASTAGTADIEIFREALLAGQPGGHLYTRLLGMEVDDTAGLIRRIEEGLPVEALEHFRSNMDISLDEAADLVRIRRRTLSRRKSEGRLQPDESDRLVRASRVFGRTLELFEGDAAAARQWLAHPQPALGGVVPWAIARTDVGARAIEDLIGRLEHGVFS